MKEGKIISEIIPVITIIVFLSTVSAVLYNLSIFTTVQYKLTIQSPNGSGSTNPATGVYAYYQGTYVKITATSSSGWQFDHWVLDGVNEGSLNPIAVTMNSAKSLTATFTQNQYTVTVTTSGQGSVAKSPSQSSYVYGSSVQLTATPASGYSFTGWSGDLSGSANPATIVVNGNEVVTATFTQNQYILTVKSPNGSGSTNPGNGTYVYNNGANVTVSSTPSSGWQFSYWILDGVDSGSTNTTNVTMNAAHMLQAVFIQSSIRYVYHCALVTDSDTWDDHLTSNVRTYINNYVALTGKSLYAYSSWGGEWNGSDTGGDFAWVLAYGADGQHSLLPLCQEGLVKAVILIWNPYKTYTDSQTLKNITAGLEDDYIRRIAGECKANGYPIFIRLGSEMNINQGGSYGGTWASNPTDFINAWKHIVDIFRSEGVTNVQWVWNPNCVDIGPHHWTEYYPGDDYVDWVGIDLYQFYDASEPATLMGIYDDYASRKPVGIFEYASNSYEWTGSTTSDATRAAWLEKFFDAVEARPNIKLISIHYVRYFRFDSSTFPLTTAKYRERIANSLYIN